MSIKLNSTVVSEMCLNDRVTFASLWNLTRNTRAGCLFLRREVEQNGNVRSCMFLSLLVSCYSNQ